MCELVVFDGHFPSTTAYGIQKRETEIKQLNDTFGTCSTETVWLPIRCSAKSFRALLSTDQVTLLRSQWIQTFLFILLRRSFVRSFACLGGIDSFEGAQAVTLIVKVASDCMKFHGADLNQANDRRN